MAEQEKDPDPKRHGGTALFSFVSQRAPRFADPTLDGAAAPRREVESYIAGTTAWQSAYATASGSLIQFNAIMIGLGGAASAQSGGLLKGVVAAALLLHILAALVLCWAARPVAAKRELPLVATAISNYRHADDTFRNYRRGWRMTLLALVASSLASGIFVLNAFDVAVPVAW